MSTYKATNAAARRPAAPRSGPAERATAALPETVEAPEEVVLVAPVLLVESESVGVTGVDPFPAAPDPAVGEIPEPVPVGVANGLEMTGTP